jgi:hypothetical protein
MFPRGLKAVPVILDGSTDLAVVERPLHEIEVDDRTLTFRWHEPSKSGREFIRSIQNAQSRMRASKSNKWIGFEDICVCPVGWLPLWRGRLRSLTPLH